MIQKQLRRTYNIKKELVDLLEITILLFIYVLGLIIIFTSDADNKR